MATYFFMHGLFTFCFQDVRKKGSAPKLSKITTSLVPAQKDMIEKAGFDGLLKIKCNFIPEKLSTWLINYCDINKFEIVIPARGVIKVDEVVVHRVFGIPMGQEYIDYEKKSFADTFGDFYRLFKHEHDQKAPTFIEAENWLL